MQIKDLKKETIEILDKQIVKSMAFFIMKSDIARISILSILSIFSLTLFFKNNFNIVGLIPILSVVFPYCFLYKNSIKKNKAYKVNIILVNKLLNKLNTIIFFNMTILFMLKSSINNTCYKSIMFMLTATMFFLIALHIKNRLNIISINKLILERNSYDIK